MLLLFLVSFIHSVASSKLTDANPYDDNKNTKYYLSSGCRLLTDNHSKKYESGGIRVKQWVEYYQNCIFAIWPGGGIEEFHGSGQRFVPTCDSFKKGKTLVRNGTDKYVAHEDGFVLSRGRDFVRFLYYHKNKPPMNLKLLQKLPWPQDKDLLNYRDVEIRKIVTSKRAKHPHRPDVAIKLANNLRPISFANLIIWIKALFNMEKYDSAQLGKFRHILASSLPGIELLKIHKLGSMTRVLPLHDRFKLILPDEDIAERYDPEVLEAAELVNIPKYSTIITDFEHKGTTYCLVLTFDVLEEMGEE